MRTTITCGKRQTTIYNECEGGARETDKHAAGKGRWRASQPSGGEKGPCSALQAANEEEGKPESD